MIGYAISKVFAEGGDRVTITGRRTAVVEAAAAMLGATPVSFDGTDPHAVRTARRVARSGGRAARLVGPARLELALSRT